MRTFLAAVLSVIAAGVVLIAYGLLGPRAAAAPDGSVMQYDARGDMYRLARPMYASERVPYGDPYLDTARAPLVSPASVTRPAVAYQPVAAPAPQRARATTTRTVVERNPGRDWMKTALVIGGTTATGAGIGAIVGGKKGALIGAAIGGGASTLYEAKKK